MSSETSPISPLSSEATSSSVQLVAWLVGLATCSAGMLGLVAEWEPGLATAQMLFLAVAPVLAMLPAKRRTYPEGVRKNREGIAVDWLLSFFVASVSLAASSGVGRPLEYLPPAYHDEYSYLFQAKTLLAGHLSFPSPAVHPELFDQIHVLNEGRMASRYYPGTGAWLAPFVALGHPYWGMWFAGAIAAMLIYWTGRELGGRLVGLIAGLLLALSPGVALFGNMLLAHHPTLLGLSVFLLGVTRLQRTRSGCDALVSGVGLSFAMLCRPMTAAGFGLPFGMEIAWWLAFAKHRPDDRTAPPNETSRSFDTRRILVALGLGLPLILGWLVMLGYNRNVTGHWLTSPYQLYTDIYTPRHVYGFDNVLRGERHLGPKVIEYYDQWAENLTPALAARNVFNRWIASWLWTLDFLPLVLSTIVLLGTLVRLNWRWRYIVAAILSLHAVHIPYWYVGIMGWHYVFETAPLWCLVVAAVTQGLFNSWSRSRLIGLKVWWLALIGLSVAGCYLNLANVWSPRIAKGISSLTHPRLQQAEIRNWIESSVDQRPAIVLLDQTEIEQNHIDLVTNDPGLASEIIVGRFHPGTTNATEVARAFPTRTLYVGVPSRRTMRRIVP